MKGNLNPAKHKYTGTGVRQSKKNYNDQADWQQEHWTEK